MTRIDAYTASGSAAFNIDERSTIGSTGSYILSAATTAVTTGVSVTGSFNDSSLASGNWLWLQITAVSGSPSQLVVTLATTV